MRTIGRWRGEEWVGGTRFWDGGDAGEGCNGNRRQRIGFDFGDSGAPGDSSESGGIKKRKPGDSGPAGLIKSKPACDSSDPGEFRDRRRRICHHLSDSSDPGGPGKPLR